MKTQTKDYVFLVDDDEMYLKTLRQQVGIVENKGEDKDEIEFRTFSSGEDCLKNLDLNPEIVVLDYYLNRNKALNGIQVLDKIKARNPDTQVIMLSSQENLEVAVNCIKHGAFDYVIKSESAFVRTKHLLNNILFNTELKRGAKTFGAWNLVVAAIFLIVIILSLIML
jgi:two-component system OmpR family response regulator